MLALVNMLLLSVAVLAPGVARAQDEGAAPSAEAEAPPAEEEEEAGSCPASAWTGGWIDGTGLVDPAASAAMDAWAFPALSPEDEAARVGVRTEGVVVIQDGAILYERYDRGFGPETPHLTWSASKSFTATLAGIAVERGVVTADDSICDHLAATDPDNCAITIRDLLSFGSGLWWRETYENQPPTTSSVVAMLYGEGAQDMAAFVSSAPRAAEPGAQWQYSSGDTTLLSSVLGEAYAKAGVDDPAWSLLFEPLGMEGIVWERDGAGHLVGSSYLYGPPRQLAKAGQLWLDDGCWEGERLLPEGWMAQMTSVSAPIQRRAVAWEPEGVEGWQIWLNRPVPALGSADLPWPSSPADAYAARGHWKQTVAVFPSLGMIVVRVGDDRDDQSFSYDTLFSLAAAMSARPAAPVALPQPVPLAAAGSGETAPSPEPVKFDAGLLKIGANYGAKLACSCRYVMGQSEEYCRAWVRASPDVVKIRFDDEEKVVKARALGLVRSSASWRGETQGCSIDD